MHFRHIYEFCYCGLRVLSHRVRWSGDQNGSVADRPQSKQQIYAGWFLHLRNHWYQTGSKKIEICTEYVLHNGPSVILSSPHSDSCLHDHAPEL